MTLSDLTVRQAKAADKAYNLPDTDGLGPVSYTHLTLPTKLEV